jgi:hypothetical protein
MRDLSEAEIYQLETLMDKTSLRSVLSGVAYILEGKSAHLAENWQDHVGSGIYAKAADTLWKLIEKPIFKIHVLK